MIPGLPPEPEVESPDRAAVPNAAVRPDAPPMPEDSPGLDPVSPYEKLSELLAVPHQTGAVFEGDWSDNLTNIEIRQLLSRGLLHPSHLVNQ